MVEDELGEDKGLVLHSRHLATLYHGKFHRLIPSRVFSIYEGNLLQKSPPGLPSPQGSVVLQHLVVVWCSLFPVSGLRWSPEGLEETGITYLPLLPKFPVSLTTPFHAGSLTSRTATKLPKWLERAPEKQGGHHEKTILELSLAENVMLPDFNKSCVTSIWPPETDKRLTAENRLTGDGFCLSIHGNKIYTRPLPISSDFDREVWLRARKQSLGHFHHFKLLVLLYSVPFVEIK